MITPIADPVAVGPAAPPGPRRAAPPATWAFETGDEMLPRRRAQALLATGERFEVYVAWNERLMSPTVVKMLRPPLLDRPMSRRAVRSEASLLGRVNHPGLPRLFGHDADGERPFIEIEFLDGPRLSTLVRRHGRLMPEQLYPLARQLFATLVYLHGEGIVHLDVKPKNVIMSPVPRLIDLSVARDMEAARRISGFIGTDAYMAPEQADSARFGEIGPAADVWGVGVTLYEAAAKRRPFPTGRRGGSSVQRFPQLVHAAAPLPEWMPRALAELISSTLSPDPQARPTPAELFTSFDELASRAGVGRLYLR